MTEITLIPIGLVHSPLKRNSDVPIQPKYSEYEGEIELFPEFAEGLKGLEMLDGTPVLDIKPYVPGFVKSGDEVRVGWLKDRSDTTDGAKSERDKKLER